MIPGIIQCYFTYLPEEELLAYFQIFVLVAAWTNKTKFSLQRVKRSAVIVM